MSIYSNGFSVDVYGSGFVLFENENKFGDKSKRHAFSNLADLMRFLNGAAGTVTPTLENANPTIFRIERSEIIDGETFITAKAE